MLSSLKKAILGSWLKDLAPTFHAGSVATIGVVDIAWEELIFINNNYTETATVTPSISGIVFEAFDPDIVFDPNGGEYILAEYPSNDFDVALSTAAELMYYTTDGSDPDTGSSSVTSGESVQLGTLPKTIKVRNYTTGLGLGAVQERTYTDADHQQADLTETSNVTPSVSGITFEEITLVEPTAYTEQSTVTPSVTGISWVEIDPVTGEPA